MPYADLQVARKYNREWLRPRNSSGRFEANPNRQKLTQEEYSARQKRDSKKYRMKVRMDVLTHYGGNPPLCACCNEAHLEFLVIDHIVGGGTKERKANINKRAGWAFYVHLRMMNYPVGYRVLCDNCNSALGFYGYCP